MSRSRFHLLSLGPTDPQRVSGSHFLQGSTSTFPNCQQSLWWSIQVILPLPWGGTCQASCHSESYNNPSSAGHHSLFQMSPLRIPRVKWYAQGHTNALTLNPVVIVESKFEASSQSHRGPHYKAPGCHSKVKWCQVHGMLKNATYTEGLEHKVHCRAQSQGQPGLESGQGGKSPAGQTNRSGGSSVSRGESHSDTWRVHRPAEKNSEPTAVTDGRMVSRARGAERMILKCWGSKPKAGRKSQRLRGWGTYIPQIGDKTREQILSGQGTLWKWKQKGAGLKALDVIHQWGKDVTGTFLLAFGYMLWSQVNKSRVPEWTECT